MRLSELKTGESATIVKVLGHGGFRRRIVELGFVRGNRVEVLLNAPLKDPIEYRLLGYNISLRRSEAEMVVVVTEEEAVRKMARAEVDTQVDDEYIAAAVDRRKRHINVALVGNPNCGKTSLFNHITGEHEHVGNYSGVTVGAFMPGSNSVAAAILSLGMLTTIYFLPSALRYSSCSRVFRATILPVHT